ncbi:MAG TPA: hypothetical protein P5241_01550 [Candidatus Paceibacterota bacterium]|nr:hypothetical protein [Candidatus Paceibacterota bacterium]
MKNKCELCEREVLTDEHHLIPKTNHNNKWFLKHFTKDEMNNKKINVCYDCHLAIHKFIPDEKELGKSYNTKELLLSHPKIYKFVEWIKKQSGNISKTKT